MLPSDVTDFIEKESLERFLRYVVINTRADDESGTHPSSPQQKILGALLVEEMKSSGLKNVEIDEFGYVYGTLPASEDVESSPITFCAHMDTSPDESGENVKPMIRANYDGKTIRYPDNHELELTPEDCPELKDFIGHTLITASGNTLLGADDKAGIAEIMAALEAFKVFPQLKHPELRIVFTPDEEIGEGTALITMEKLATIGYTFDGGMIGELEDECFTAHGVTVTFTGANVHPGYAKNRMINAAGIAARFYAMIPEYETPERTELREGFYHMSSIKGDENSAELKFILRDFEKQLNLTRVAYIESLVKTFEIKYPGLQIHVNVKEQYNNMREVLENHPEVTEKARKAIEMAGIPVLKKAIRGGTDGARLSFKGIPTPNIFAGGLMFHSKKEWIPQSALTKGTEVMIHLCALWA